MKAMLRWAPKHCSIFHSRWSERTRRKCSNLSLRMCRLGRGSSDIKIGSQLKDAPSNAAVGVCVGLRGELQLFTVCPWLARIICCSVSEYKSSESKAKSSVPARKTGRRVREALLNRPPYPPSIRVLLRVQSVLIQSEALSPSA
jgi:hypothetical protein